MYLFTLPLSTILTSLQFTFKEQLYRRIKFHARTIFISAMVELPKLFILQTDLQSVKDLFVFDYQ